MKIWTFDTTLRDGTQGEAVSFSVEDKLIIAQKLDELGIDYIEGGFENMRYSVSDTAEYGDYTRGPRVIDDHVRQTMRQILKEVQIGAFAREWILENQAGRPGFLKLREQALAHPTEAVGHELRAMMGWLHKKAE